MRARDYYRKPASPWPRRALMAVLAIVLVVSMTKLIGYFVSMRQEQALRQELTGMLITDAPQTMVPTQPTSEAAPTPTAAQTPQLRTSLDAFATFTPDPRRMPEILMTYHALYERNSDLVGWLNVRALPQVDLPVVQRDHVYYLRRDFYGRSNMNGTAFMDVSGSIWPRSDNLIIYAHNMKSGEMFGALHKLMDEPFYRETPLASFNTIYERANYVPIAVVLCSIHQGEDFFNFHVTDFRSREDFDDYIARARALSSVYPPYDAVYGDQLLTLVTCYDEANTKRLLVLLRRVRENEDLDELAVMWH